MITVNVGIKEFKDLVEIAREFAFILQYYTDDPNDGNDILKVIKAYNKEKHKGNKFIQSLFNRMGLEIDVEDDEPDVYF